MSSYEDCSKGSDMMKRFLAILVLGLFLITPSQADDIRDFQIEGMSIGDSALDYFSEKMINKEKSFLYKSKKFYSVSFDKRYRSLKTYDDVQFLMKNNDKKYIIYSITGRLFYYNNIDDCYKKKDEIVKELSSIFKNSQKKDWGKEKFYENSSDNSTVSTVYFYFKLGGAVKVACYDWSKKEEEKGVSDGLGVIINSKEFEEFLKNEANK